MNYQNSHNNPESKYTLKQKVFEKKYAIQLKEFYIEMWKRERTEVSRIKFKIQEILENYLYDKNFQRKAVLERRVVVSGENSKKKNISKSEYFLKVQMIEANGEIWVMMKAIQMWE